MGCSGSKVDDQQAVALCRDRSRLMAEAVRARRAFAEAHVAYACSLRSVGAALRRFLDARGDAGVSEPVVPLPSCRKEEPSPPPSPVAHHLHSRSNSGSHIRFPSESESESDSDTEWPLHSSDSENEVVGPTQTNHGSVASAQPPLQHKAAATVASAHRRESSEPVHHKDSPDASSATSTTVPDAAAAAVPPVAVTQRPQSSGRVQHIAATPAAAPSVALPQRPESSEPVHRLAPAAPPSTAYGQQRPRNFEPDHHFDAAAAARRHPFQYSYLRSYPYPSFYPDPSSNALYGGVSGFSGWSSPPPAVQPRPEAALESTSTRFPPPPPSPPRTPAWDFLNPFESYDSFLTPYYSSAAYTSSRSPREVREEEGIPDLEDIEDYEEEEEEEEIVKVASGERNKVAASTSVENPSKSSVSSTSDEEDEVSGIREDPQCDVGSSGTAAASAAEHDADVVDDNVVAANVERQEVQPDVIAPRKYESVSEVLEEIETQFKHAAQSTDEVSFMLGMRKLVQHDTSGMLNVSPSSLSYEEFSDFEEDMHKGTKSLSTTLQKLYLWEKKLYEEVRAEEDLRVLHEKYCKRLKHLDQKGAEAHKIDETETMIRKLSTRIKMAIQVVGSISNRIHKLRDEELWPRICELMQGLMAMWRVMFECYKSQSQAFYQMKSLESTSSGGKFSDALMEATKLLEFEMLDWVGSFSAWINAQRRYIRIMDSWLLKCIYYEPEETPDGIMPFSPGRLGAPPVFGICKYWSEAMERISEREVVDAMRSFAANVLRFWQQHHFEQRQMVMANGNKNTTLKMLENEGQEMRRAVDAKSKKLVLEYGQSGLSLYEEKVDPAHKVEVSSLQLSLSQIFEAMENFAASSKKVYEELYLHSEEEAG